LVFLLQIIGGIVYPAKFNVHRQPFKSSNHLMSSL